MSQSWWVKAIILVLGILRQEDYHKFRASLAIPIQTHVHTLTKAHSMHARMCMHTHLHIHEHTHISTHINTWTCSLSLSFETLMKGILHTLMSLLPSSVALALTSLELTQLTLSHGQYSG